MAMNQNHDQTQFFGALALHRPLAITASLAWSRSTHRLQTLLQQFASAVVVLLHFNQYLLRAND
jgi:hypothetical protein